MIKLSIIIPIFCVENYIKNFLESLLPQTNGCVELIFVDDGTNDNSFEILRNMLFLYPQENVKIIRQKNQGLSVARNNGMKQVSGKYFTFLDPDDEVNRNYIVEILRVISLMCFDIMHINATRINAKNKVEKISLCKEEGLVSVSDEQLEKIFNKGHWYAWLRIFNNKFLKILNFEENKTFEDILSLPRCYNHAKTLYSLPHSLVTYHYRENSISNSINKSQLMKNIDSFIFGINLYRNMIHDYKYLIIFKQFILMTMYTLNENDAICYIKYALQSKDDRAKALKCKNIAKKNDYFILKHPILYFLYKKQSNFFRLKFLRN